MFDGSFGRVARSICVAAIVLAVAAPALARSLADWTTLESTRFGFSIAYPANIFVKDTLRSSDDGMLLQSTAGDARLLVGAFVNADNTTLADYRTFLLAHSYQGGSLDYASRKRTSFVLSGELRGKMFYERVSFTCGGRLINSWAMIYPVTERRFYDRLVEAVAETYSPGAGRDGACDFGSS